MYKPSKNNELCVEAINDAYEKLPFEEQVIIDKLTASLKKHINSKVGADHKMATEASLLELVGKVGMWLMLNEKGNGSNDKSK
jgi:hypothetical protein